MDALKMGCESKSIIVKQSDSAPLIGLLRSDLVCGVIPFMVSKTNQTLQPSHAFIFEPLMSNLFHQGCSSSVQKAPITHQSEDDPWGRRVAEFRVGRRRSFGSSGCTLDVGISFLPRLYTETF